MYTTMPPEASNIQPRDLVRLDNGETEYRVQAVSRAGQDIYVTEGAQTSIGTWAAAGSVTHVNRAAVQ